MKKLCCINCPAETPNLNFNFKFVSTCCASRTENVDMPSTEVHDEVDGDIEEEKVLSKLCCCCRLRKRKNQAKECELESREQT